MSVAEPTQRRFTREEYSRMADSGMFIGQRVELIEGEVVVLSPQKPRHYLSMCQAGKVLEEAFGRGFWVRVQGPLDFGAFSEPEPDISVVKERPTITATIIRTRQYYSLRSANPVWPTIGFEKAVSTLAAGLAITGSSISSTINLKFTVRRWLTLHTLMVSATKPQRSSNPVLRFHPCETARPHPCVKAHSAITLCSRPNGPFTRTATAGANGNRSPPDKHAPLPTIRFRRIAGR